MRIKNRSNGSLLAENAVLCASPLSKFMGLMFSMDKSRVLVFEFAEEINISLHMLFVFYSIDVLFLDRRKTAVDMKKNFMPFTFYSSRAKAKYAIELPAGKISKTGTKLGDRIYF